MAGEFTAQIVQHRGRWCLYVILRDWGVEWPEHWFPEGGAVPTFTQRADVLAAFGFEQVPGARWEWMEGSADPTDPSSRILLFATLRVRSRTGARA